MKIICPDYINIAFNLLDSYGYNSFAVGGCIRDSIMGRMPNDWDMTTSSVPDETLSVFKTFKTVPTGIKHGTITVFIKENPIEITTMRIDGSYTDNRRPDEVHFTQNITDDLSRRDFTVNAIAYNHKSGIVDPFHGLEDIENRIIRCVGEPDKRFHEDALRIIRALRFASVLGFEIEENTAKSIMKNYKLLQNVAKERIRVELLKLLCGANVEKILTEYKEVFFFIIPQLKAQDGFCQHTKFHIYDVWTHTVKVVANIENTPIMRMTALLHDIEKPSSFTLDDNGTGHFKGHPQKGAETAEKILKDLRFSNAEIKQICDIIRLHDERPDGDIIKLTHLCSENSTEIMRCVMRFMKAELLAKNPEYIENDTKKCDIALKQIDKIESSNIPLNVRSLNISGTDLINLGFESHRIGTVLSSLLSAVIDRKIKNENEALIKYAKENLWEEL